MCCSYMQALLVSAQSAVGDGVSNMYGHTADSSCWGLTQVGSAASAVNKHAWTRLGVR